MGRGKLTHLESLLDLCPSREGGDGNEAAGQFGTDGLRSGVRQRAGLQSHVGRQGEAEQRDRRRWVGSELDGAVATAGSVAEALREGVRG